MLAVGDSAPDFSAPNQDGKTFKLSSLRGTPVVLYFYPKADTPGCTIEAKGFRDVHAEFAARKVHVIGVSTDDCPAQKAFEKKYGLNFPLIADTSHSVGTAYGVLSPQGSARRVTFMIDAGGKIVEVVEGSPAEKHVAAAQARFLK